MSVFVHLVEWLADLLAPVFHASATAAAIIAFTALVRLLVHPLSRAAARGRRAGAALRPRIAELRAKHARDPERLRQAVLDLHAEERVSPLAGILPALAQAPAFLLLYYVFSHTTIGGETNGLLTHQLLDAPLAGDWTEALAAGGMFGGAGLVYLALFAVVGVVALLSCVQTRRAMAAARAVNAGGGGSEAALPGAFTKVMPLLSFGTLITVAVVPLAAALYIATSTTWSAVERAVLNA